MPRRDLAEAPDRARLEIEFEQPYLLGPLFGDYDRHLIAIEQRLGVHISARGNRGAHRAAHAVGARCGQRDVEHRAWLGSSLDVDRLQPRRAADHLAGMAALALDQDRGVAADRGAVERYLLRGDLQVQAP